MRDLHISNLPEHGGAGREDELVSAETLDGAVARLDGESDIEEILLITEVAEAEVDVIVLTGVVIKRAHLGFCRERGS